MEKKKEKSILLVLFTIFILLLFIILPPLFRNLFPKEVVEDTTNVNKIEILTCTITNNNEKYSVTSRIKYINNIIQNNTITYKPISDNNSINNTTGSNYISVTDQFNYFNTLQDVVITNNDDGSIIIKLDKSLLTSNQNNETLNNYLSKIDIEEEFFTSQGYTCSSLSS